jgi:hypothetical protein
MRSPIKLTAGLALIAGLLLPISGANALTVKWAPAGWTDYFAAPSTAQSITKIAPASPSRTKSETALSTFNLTYVNVPENEKPAIQAAADSWAANWKSAVPINITATFTRQASTSVLASATPVKFFNAFKGAPDSELWYPSRD